MPRPRLERPNCRVHQKSGLAFVELNGQRRYLGKADDPATQDRYELLCSQIKANGGSFAATAENFTVLALSVFALNKAKQCYAKRDGTLTTSYAMFRRSLAFLVKYHGDELASNFTTGKLETLREKMLDDGSAQGTVQKTLIYLKLAFKWASTSDLIDDALASKLLKVEGPRSNDPRLPEPVKLAPANPDHVSRTLPFLSPSLRAMVQLQELTGMRAGEVCRMTPGQIDRTNQKCWLYLPHQHKMQWKGKTRKVPLGPQCQTILARFMLRPDDAPLFSPRESARWFRLPVTERTDEVVFVPRVVKPITDRRRKVRRVLGDAYSANTYSRSITRVCVELGIKRWSPIMLRKLAATRTDQEHGALAAARLLGHSSARITEEHYITRNDADLMKLAQ